MDRKFKEIKRHLNKPTELYDCDLLRSEAGHVVLKYVSDRQFASTRLGITFPPGCITIAFYWKTHPYVFWGIFSPEKELLGYLVHICTDVSISEDSVSYLDLLLDIWFYPDGRYIVLDADEVEECLQSGRLTLKDREFIEQARERAIDHFEADSRNLRAVADALDIWKAPK